MLKPASNILFMKYCKFVKFVKKNTVKKSSKKYIFLPISYGMRYYTMISLYCPPPYITPLQFFLTVLLSLPHIIAFVFLSNNHNPSGELQFRETRLRVTRTTGTKHEPRRDRHRSTML